MSPRKGKSACEQFPVPSCASGGPSAVRGPRLRRGARLPGPDARRGAVPAWIPLALLFLGLFAGLGALQKDARRHGVASVDATRYRLQTPTRWLSPAWLDELEQLLVEVREISTDDVDQIRGLTTRLGNLPFVAEVGSAEVQWPDGLIVSLRLHEPVACIPAGGRDFLPVAADGTVLGGYAFAPHDAYGGWLPTLGPHGSFDRPVQPGAVLESEAHLAALSVAESMWKYLDARDLRQLGRVFIDASAPDAPVFDRAPGSVTPRRLPGGVIIALEDGRRVYFGCAPEPPVDGELPAALKWGHLRQALADASGPRPPELRPGDSASRDLPAGSEAEGIADWALLDVRFDRAIRRTRAEVEDFARQGALELDVRGNGR